MKRKSGVYVRAKDPSGRWGSVLAEDLTLESFMHFVLAKLHNCGVVVRVTEEGAEPFEYRTDKHIVEGPPTPLKDHTGDINAEIADT